MPRIAHRIIEGNFIEIIDLEENDYKMKYTTEQIIEMAMNDELYCPVCGAKYNTFKRNGIIYFSAPYKNFKHKDDCTEYTTKKEVLTSRTLSNLNEWIAQMTDDFQYEREEEGTGEGHRGNSTHGSNRTVSLNLNNIHKLIQYILKHPEFIHEKINDSLRIKDLFVFNPNQCIPLIESNFSKPFIIVFRSGTSCMSSTYTSYTKMKINVSRTDEEDFTLYFDESDFDFSAEYPYEDKIHGYALVRPKSVRQKQNNRCVIDISADNWIKGIDEQTKKTIHELRRILRTSLNL